MQYLGSTRSRPDLSTAARQGGASAERLGCIPACHPQPPVRALLKAGIWSLSYKTFSLRFKDTLASSKIISSSKFVPLDPAGDFCRTARL
jgi:hypothetical protein